MPDDAVYYINCALIFLWKKRPLVSLSNECKSCHNINENQRSHQGNKYHRDARKVAPESVRSSKKHNTISHQADDALKERQSK